jgi:phenylacetyl-CoA:acceptor oxidoreductase subunit 2
MSVGPRPTQQWQWDGRAAANFMGGGAGAGLMFFGAVLSIEGAPVLFWGSAAALGFVLMGLGLSAVFMEIGRPLRAFNVILNPRTSWMSREALVAAVLSASVLVLLVTRSVVVAAVVALAALAFAWSQGRILRASKGIAAWSDRAVPPLIVVTGLAEGLGLALVIAALIGVAPGLPAVAPGLPAVMLAVLLLGRLVLWYAYRRRVAAVLAPAARQALDLCGTTLAMLGTAAPVALIVAAIALGRGPETLGPVWGASALFALAGLLSWGTGWWFKYVLVRRAAHTRGFSLPHTPVRGRR